MAFSGDGKMKEVVKCDIKGRKTIDELLYGVGM
jgi:hypothetical protein